MLWGENHLWIRYRKISGLSGLIVGVALRQQIKHHHWVRISVCLRRGMSIIGYRLIANESIFNNSDPNPFVGVIII